MALIDKTKLFFNLLFGKDKSFFTQNSIMIGQRGAVLIDVEKPGELYFQIPQLRTIIGKKKSMFANVTPILKDDKGNKIEGKKAEDLMKLIYSPNVMQSMNEFLENYLEQLDVYGNQFIYKNKTQTADFPVALWNISPRYISPVMTGKVFEQISVEGIIKQYDYNDGTQKRIFKTSEIMYSRHNDIDNAVIGTSPLKFLKYPLSNIDGGYKFRNVIINEKGAIGILSSGGSKDSFGAIPMTNEEKQRIENQHRASYGISDGQMRTIITEASLNWQPMTYPTKDLMLFEEIDEDTKVLIDHFGMNVHLFANSDTTFENLKSSVKQVYSDTIQPCADKFFDQLTQFLNVEKIFGAGAYICPSYEHIKILQEDKKESADLFKTNVESVIQLSNNGLITSDQAKEIILSMSGVQI